MQDPNTQYYINRLQLVISYPERFIPTLSESAIKSIVIESITGYFEGELPLDILVTIVDNLLEFKEKVNKQNNIVIDVLLAISSMSIYEQTTDIDTLLAKQLDKLSQE